MSASTARKSLIRATEDGERRWFFGGGLHIWKATADDTDGAFLLFEDRVDHGKVTPLHLHPDSDETMIVLQGEILMHLDGAEHTVRAGGIASAPRGIPHAFKVSGADGARLLRNCSPASSATRTRAARWVGTDRWLPGRLPEAVIGWPCRYICGGLLPAAWPPSTGMTAPVMNEDRPEQSHSTVCATSETEPVRRIGTESPASRCASGPAASRWWVRIGPGATTLTRMPWSA